MAATDTPALDSPIAAEEAKSVDHARRWTILILLAVGATIAFMSRQNIAAALADKPFIKEFHLSDVDRGLLNSAFFWSYAVLQIPMGWIVDRYGVKIPYAINFLLWCLASAATGLTHSVAGLATMRVITGAGEAIVVPASYRWIRDNFKEDQAGSAVGIYMLGTKIGPAIGAPIAAMLITAYNWQLMFVMIGVGGLLWLVPWMALVKNDKPVVLTAVQRKKSDVPMRNIMASPLVWGTIVINFCYNYFVFYCMTWMPSYLVEQRHLSLTKSGVYTGFSFLGIGIVALVSGWIADRMIKRGGDPVVIRKAFVIAGFAIATTEILGVMAPSLNMALFWTVVSLSGLGLCTANHLALCRLTLIPKPAVGRVTGVQNVSTSLAGIVTPILSGWLKQTTGSYQAPMLAIFFFLVIGGVTALVLLRRKWAPKVPEAAYAAAA
ncbi:MAG TPA: MFS transporter [Caulobacteraceae bacterium]|nr:MFS transporter [Caulobacteraceae bacterium]